MYLSCQTPGSGDLSDSVPGAVCNSGFQEPDPDEGGMIFQDHTISYKRTNKM